MRKAEEMKTILSQMVCLNSFDYQTQKQSGMTLSDILEQNVDQKYFLSEKSLQGLMKGQSKPQLILLQQEDTQEECTAQ